MPQFTDSRVLDYPFELIKAIILDVERYAEFIPWVNESETFEQKENAFKGALTIGYAPLSHRYVSDIHHGAQDQKYVVEAKCKDAPFKLMVNKWEITEIEKNKTKVALTLDLNMEFGMLAMAVNAVFEKTAFTMIEAFEKRAEALSK